ncbi:uncharacterized protein K02A2.6-like [Uranotaenia lowii]|uniref:uncharacterized protein K02A2.6-like n=1 Tax=Uranotaenia lowii TaxID=190385 RepID=UPI00247A0EB0|nr:uncharacterized protein K02A2.6-like [Uranotaenia lowii]
MNHNIQPFEIGDSASVGRRWTAWKRSFELYLACNTTVTADKKKAMLLHLAGQEVQEVFYDDPNHEAGAAQGSDVYISAIEILDQHFQPIVCIPHERAVFRKMSQNESESVAKFVRRLRHQGVLCEYGNALEMRITEQVFDGCLSNGLREVILKKRLTQLAEIMEEGKVLETIDLNQQQLGAGGSASVNKVKSGTNKCFRCGSSKHYANDIKCPARKEKCDKCGIKGHYKNQCKTKNFLAKTKKKVRQVEESEDEEEEDGKTNSDNESESDESDAYHVFATKNEKSTLEIREVNSNKYNSKVKCLVGGVPLEWLVDSGASVNVIDENTWRKLKDNGCKVSCESVESKKKLLAYGNHRLEVKGVFKTDISHGAMTVHREVYVIKGHGTNLLSKITSMDLGILQITSAVLEIAEVKSVEIGKAKDLQVKINIDRSIHPVQQPCRRLPIPLQKVVDEEIQKLLDQDIIEAVTDKITWASPLVVTPKDGGRRVRLCVDMRKANTAIIPERHPLPVFEDMMPYLNGCKFFSKVDLNQAFHQLELHPDSREITTFVTTKCYYRFKRLMFGMNCAAEVFQREMEKILKGLDGVIIFIDDILIFGRTCYVGYFGV